MTGGEGQGWESFGLRLWQGVPARMPRPHQHDEIELNVVTSGALTYEFGGEPRALTAGTRRRVPSH